MLYTVYDWKIDVFGFGEKNAENNFVLISAKFFLEVFLEQTESFFYLVRLAKSRLLQSSIPTHFFLLKWSSRISNWLWVCQVGRINQKDMVEISLFPSVQEQYRFYTHI